MESKINFIPIDYDYFDFEGRNYARIVGRSDDGKRVCLIDECDVYFWAIVNEGVSEKKIKEICGKIEEIVVNGKARQSKVLKTEVHDKNFLGKKYRAIKIFITNMKDAHDIADEIGFKEIYKRREYDLGYITKYILERKLKPLNWYEISGELLNNSMEYGGIDQSMDVDLVLDVNNIKEIEVKKTFKPRVLAYDIETDEFGIGEGEILMVSLVGENFKKVITCKQDSKLKYVDKVEDEEELIEKFVEYVKEYDPDILTGYFSDGFDLPYLRARADKLRVKLGLGLDGSQPKFRRGNVMTGKINGLVHVDLLRFVRVVYSQYMQSETMGLNDVAYELLGEEKDNWEFVPTEKIKGKMWDEFYGYNLKDSELTYKLFEKIWPDMQEFTRVVEEPLFDVSRYSMSNLVENYIMHNLEEYNEIIEKKPVNDMIGARRAEDRYEGAFVFQPIPGLYEDVVFFDFTSMYGSVIVSFNLSRESYLNKKEKNSTMVDIGEDKVYFAKDVGFFPKMLANIIETRKKYKKEYNKDPSNLLKARSNAFKLLANAAYGYLGYFGARYYCREAAASTAALARREIKKAIAGIEKKGYKIVYSDTDSIAFLQGKKSRKDVNSMLKDINSDLPGIMELDLEGFFKRGIWVTKRNGDFGAKKKYALLGDGGVKIKGFETVRRDWCGLARETQSKILNLILENGDEKKALDYLKKVVKKLKNREIDLDSLMIRTQLKRNVEDYKASGPHVIIARRMKEMGLKVGIGTLIEYYIAESNEKRSSVGGRAKLPTEKGEYDIEYYLKSQILPSVENIMEVFEVNVQELFEGKKQMSLGDF